MIIERHSLVSTAVARLYAAAVWDPDGQQLLVFGGKGGDGDVWGYQPATDAWSQYVPDDPQPVILMVA